MSSESKQYVPVERSRRVRNFLANHPVILLTVTALFLMGADRGGEGTDDQARLRDQQKRLRQQVEVLKRDQNFLLFQKEMYAVDSKYLIIDMATKKGQLKYKNRVLKDFTVTLASRAGRPSPGAVELTNKLEGATGRNALVFGTSFVLRIKRAPPARREAGIPLLLLSKKDFMPLYYAVDIGAKAYILP